MAEVHIIGQLLNGSNFPKQNLFCKWNIITGENWRVVSGKNSGQTQVDNSLYSDTCNWSFPIDVHFATKGIQGWPKIYVQVFHLDWLGRVHIFGYGVLTIPTSSGAHVLDCFTWKPIGSWKDRITQYFLGGGIQLKYPDLLYTSAERYRLKTETMGVVRFEIGVILRNFEKFGIEYK